MATVTAAAAAAAGRSSRARASNESWGSEGVERLTRKGREDERRPTTGSAEMPCSVGGVQPSDGEPFDFCKASDEPGRTSAPAPGGNWGEEGDEVVGLRMPLFGMRLAEADGPGSLLRSTSRGRTEWTASTPIGVVGVRGETGKERVEPWRAERGDWGEEGSWTSAPIGRRSTSGAGGAALVEMREPTDSGRSAWGREGQVGENQSLMQRHDGQQPAPVDAPRHPFDRLSTRREGSVRRLPPPLPAGRWRCSCTCTTSRGAERRPSRTRAGWPGWSVLLRPSVAVGAGGEDRRV
jgi:hypothetical protein